MNRTISSSYTTIVNLAITDGNPVTLTAGVTITDASGGAALYADGGADTDWSITNAGVITEQPNGYGIQLGSAGTHVTSAVFTNQGTITGGGGVRLFNTNASSVVNQPGATITGTGTHGVVLYGSGTVTNSGLISASPSAGASDGVDLSAGGAVVNNPGATISGGSGVVLADISTLTNGGTISGLAESDLAVQFGQGGGQLIVDPGAVFNGLVVGDGAGVDLASGSGAGTLTGFDGSHFAEFNSLQFDYGAQWTVSGDSSEAGLGGMLISGFTTGDTIELTGFGAISKTFSSGTLVLGDATNDYATLHIQGPFSSSDFQIAHESGASLIFVGSAAPIVTLSGSYSTGVTLSNPIVSVTGTISVTDGVAVYGAGGAYNSWTINNTGTISSNNTYAVALGSGSSHVGYGVINNGSLGVISGGSAGIYLYGPGSVINQYGGTITGTVTNGIHVDGGLGTVVNRGVVLGGNYGVSEYEGGSVINDAGGTIAGSVDGVRISGQAGTIVNAGSLYGKVNGVYEYLSGTVTNLASGTISGGVGVVFKAVGTLTNAGVLLGTGNAVSLYEGSTLTNAGTIDAGSASAYAVLFSAGSVAGVSRLIVDPGAVFYGRIADTGGIIDLASAANAGTLGGFGTSITNFGSLQFDPGARWTVSGDSAAGGFGTIGIGGFTVGDTIDLTGFVATGYTFSNNALVLTNASASATLHIQGGFTTADFHVGSDGLGGTDVTVTATCYAAGTRILTPRGEVAIEHLRAGDLVVTVSGAIQPIRWIGYRRVELRRHPNRARVQPIRVARHAFGEGRPKRDLVLSPDHAVFVENVLVPIMHLLNHRSIARIEVDVITYYHVELPRHDILLADGMPAESYLEAGARGAFANATRVTQLHPDFVPRSDRHAMLWEASGYAPLVLAGETLDKIRRNLTRQAMLLDLGADKQGPWRRRRSDVAGGPGHPRLAAATSVSSQ